MVHKASDGFIISVIMSSLQDGSILCDPTLKQLSQSKASLMFVFSNRQVDSMPGLVSTHTEGLVDNTKLQECLSAAQVAVKAIFKFYKETVARKFSKDELL